MLEKLLMQLDISSDLTREEQLAILEEMDAKICRQISIVTDLERKASLQTRQELIEDALVELKEELQKRHECQKTQEQKRASGLVAFREEEKKPETEAVFEKDKDEILEDLERLENAYKEALETGDKARCKQIYTEVSKKAEAGDGAYSNFLGLLYHTYDYDGRFNAKAIRLFKEGAKQGWVGAICNLAIAYKKGKIINANPRKATEYLQQAAEMNAPRAYAMLTDDCITEAEDSGRKEDYAKASELAKKTFELSGADYTDKKYRKYYYRYVKYGMRGEVIQKSGEKIAELLSPLMEAAEVWVNECNELIAEAYLAEKKYNQAVGIYLKMGEKGIDYIQQTFPKMPADQNREKLEIMLENMANNEAEYDAETRGKIFCWFGQRYLEGTDVIQDDVKAYIYFCRARRLADKKVRDDVSKGIRKIYAKFNDDEWQKFSFWETVAKRGESDVYALMGDYYMTGRGGCKIDYDRAAECYIKSGKGYFAKDSKKDAEVATKFARCALSLKRAKESLATDNYEEAKEKIYQLANKDNFPDAMYFLAKSLEKGTPQFMKNEKQALSYFENAAYCKYLPAVRKMVEIYQNGLLGVSRNESKVKYWQDRLN